MADKNEKCFDNFELYIGILLFACLPAGRHFDF